MDVDLSARFLLASKTTPHLHIHLAARGGIDS